MLTLASTYSNCQGVSIVLRHQLESLQSKRPLYVLTPLTAWTWYHAELCENPHFFAYAKKLFSKYSLDQAFWSIKNTRLDGKSFHIFFHMRLKCSAKAKLEFCKGGEKKKKCLGIINEITKCTFQITHKFLLERKQKMIFWGGYIHVLKHCGNWRIFLPLSDFK